MRIEPQRQTVPLGPVSVVPEWAPQRRPMRRTRLSGSVVRNRIADRLLGATGWARQLESLSDLSRSLSEELDLDTILHVVCERVRDLVGAETVLVALPSDEGQLHSRAVVGEAAELIRGVRAGLGTTKSGRVLERGRPERVDSVFDDPEVDQDLARRINMRSGMFVPLIVGDRRIGVLMLVNRAGRDSRFSDADLRLAELFAVRAAQAIDMSQRVSREAVERVVAIQEQERRRIGRELHDETAQALALILMGVRSVEGAATDEERHTACVQLRQLSETALERVRQLSHQLRPPTLDRYGLASALEHLAEHVQTTGRLAIDVHAELAERLPEDVEAALFRVVQEALSNVEKHAHAARASVLVTRNGDRAIAIVEDDGIGFDPATIGPHTLGLVAMRERVEILGGVFEIDSRPGTGTTLRARFPVGRRRTGKNDAHYPGS